MTSIGYPQGHALLIGVANYQKVSSLPSAVLNDANDVASTLVSPSYCGYSQNNVTVLLDEYATRASILDSLSELANRVNPDDTVFIFFSGHGGRFGEPGNEDSLLATVDTDLDDIRNTSISSDELAHAFSQIKSKRFLVFIDACHAGGAAIAKTFSDDKSNVLKSGFSQNTFEKLAVGTGRVLIASCRDEEVSNVFTNARNSVFTTTLLDGLRGAADKDASGLIKVFDLFNYISDEVPKLISDTQHPIFKADNVENNFAIALNQGGNKSLNTSTQSTQSVNPEIQPEWGELEKLLIELYPMGPEDEEIWSRAGGDLSRLQIRRSGQAAWHVAIRTLKQGGGGLNINITSLVESAIEDFPNHPDLGKFKLL
ncbi:peptidase [Marinomonas sp. A3A]|uniref:caspase family protein n=1 Tax=Marinomonas sp. A3A TaxID=2065312 RepID=UPI001BB43684|nr:caspase family protein [Marinomonas sp. A3A]QUX93512.1 peptidase [Marinomonas sp. A3A]